MYFTPIWTGITLDLKLETCCHFYLVVLSCAVNRSAIIFFDSASISDCVGLPKNFAWTATEAGYNRWS